MSRPVQVKQPKFQPTFSVTMVDLIGDEPEAKIWQGQTWLELDIHQMVMSSGWKGIGLRIEIEKEQ